MIAATAAIINFHSGDCSASQGGSGMQVITLRSGRQQLVYHYWDKAAKTKRTAKKSLPLECTIADRVKIEAELIESAERRSLTTDILFENLVDLATSENDGAGQPWVYARVKRDLAGPVGADFAERFHDFIDTLGDEGKSVNTIAHHRAAVRRVLNTAYRRGEIDSIPIRDFSVRYDKPRDRILSKAEEKRLFEAMRIHKSHLQWPIRFALRRPIRKRDLFALTAANLELFGRGAPYIHYQAMKTGAETYLPLHDMPDLVDYFNHGRMSYWPLFPYRGQQVIDCDTHFNWLLDKAKIADFHFHDLRHCAVSWMLGNGYTVDQLVRWRVGTREVIDRVYNNVDPIDLLESMKKPEQGEVASGLAN